MMNRLLRPLSLLATALLFAACGDLDGFGADTLEADPLYFADQIFDCDPATPAPSCPPFRCSVDEEGRGYDCTDDRCAVGHDSTAFVFEGPPGVDLCVPEVCHVEAEGVPAVCEPGCAPDDVTTYLMLFSCPGH